jgi:hypothetical protein
MIFDPARHTKNRARHGAVPFSIQPEREKGL